MENSHNKNLSLLLLATLFISTSGVLGKYIALPAEVIILCRASFATVFIYIFCKIKKVDLKIKSKKDFYSFVISSFFMGAHWITYFIALKLSNVALGMLSLFTFPVITALLEPFFSKQKLNPIHVFLAALVLIGVYILVPDLSLENDQLKGILFGILSAFCYSFRNLTIKKHVKNYNGSMLMLYQMIIVSVLLIPVLFFSDFSNFESQLPLLVLVALLTTAIGHTMMVNSLKHFSVTTASIIGSIQPIFGIVMAYFFVNEIPSFNTYIGGSLILLTVVIESIRSKK
ncbi:DMT family transporter [Polaribacter glomeratus]|uniref:EamA family transporter n=1 Tax=Polaribacter glomeratus TaxID=102 RepID=A0A2S7WHX6_9FLAO|nr:DMT family transporter [Polaribacter glomeratus]PQJ77208.1 EamA family transporter [Polaribacter glomeratus]TXD65142.1 DMT family transporter [Polaribacter glomeratus]